MISSVHASLCFFVAFVSACECQLDGSFWWLNGHLRAAALANAKAVTEVNTDVEDYITEKEDSSVISFIDDFGNVQTYNEPVKKGRLIQLIDSSNPTNQPMKARQGDFANDEIVWPNRSRIPTNTAKNNSVKNERKTPIDDDFNDINDGQSKNVGDCGERDCSNGYLTTEKGSEVAEKDDCECQTYYDCFSGNGAPSSSRSGTSKCANRIPYMICCKTPNLNVRPEPPSQPAPAQQRSLNTEIVFNEDSSVYSNGYNFLLNQRAKRSPSVLDLDLTDTADPYWNIKNKDIDQKAHVPNSPLPIVSETNGYIPEDSKELCPNSGLKKASKPEESPSGIKKLPKNWHLRIVSETVVGSKQILGDDFGSDLDESPLIPKKLQRRHFSVFQEFNPGFGAPATTQKSQTTTRKRKASTNSDEDSDYYIPAPRIPIPKKKFGVPKLGYGSVEPEEGADTDYDSVFVDSASEGGRIYPDCGEVYYVSTEDVASARLNGKDGHTYQAISVLFDDEDRASRCTATLVHPRVAVAPAHCISSSRHMKIRIQAPVRMQERLVQAIQHPRFNPATRRNNIALLIWRTPLTLSPRLQPVCLPTPGTSFTSLLCRTSRTDGAGKRASVLSKEECEQQFLISSPRVQQHAVKHFLCSVLGPSESTCAVLDEENPLICLNSNRWHLAGTPTGLEHSPSLYTDVSEFTSWIRQVLEDMYII